MNKVELLADIADRPFFHAFTGDPVLTNTETVKDGTEKWYSVNVREIVENVGTKRNINFHVVNEGTPGEVAYYSEQSPQKSVTTDADVADQKAIETAKLQAELGTSMPKLSTGGMEKI